MPNYKTFGISISFKILSTKPLVCVEIVKIDEKINNSSSIF